MMRAAPHLPFPPPPFPRRRTLRLPALLIAWWTVCTAAPAQQADVYATPKAAAEDPDYALQGEYAGNGQGLQVIARGDGEFELVLFPGGLPGAGWTGEEPRRTDGDADSLALVLRSQELEKVQRTSPTLGAEPPPGAVVLFDGTPASLENWEEGARRSDDGLLMEGATSRRRFRDYTIHLEFRTPYQPTARGQQRGNSGLYHQGRYETQILDSFGLQGANNETGGIYAIKAPDLNACFPPLRWQTYDVDFTAARYDDQGTKTAEARITVRLNGIVVQNNVAVPSATRAAPLGEGPEPGPIYLQNHGNPVRFRNIWVLPRDSQRDARRPLLPAFERFHASLATSGQDRDPLADGGQLLAESLGCLNCHGSRHHVWEAAVGPVLDGVAGRLRPDHLVDWLRDPRGTKRGTTMPDLLGSLPADEREPAARALASYLLLADRGSELVDLAGDPAAAERGETLYHSIGCIACHAPQNDWQAPPSTSVPMGPLGEKYTLASLTAFLDDPHVTRPDGRMPRLVSDASEARDIATYLLRETVLVPGAGQFSRTVYRGQWDQLPPLAELKPVGEPDVVTGLSFAGIEPLNNFAARYEAYLPIRTDGNYEFIIGSDDGSRVLVDGREVASADGVHPYQQSSGKIDLEPGVHRLVVEYFEAGGEERLTLEIAGPELPRSSIRGWVTQDPEGNLTRELVPRRFTPDPQLREQGARLFASLGCANCHQFAPAGSRVQSTLDPPAWSKLDPSRGCLAAEVPPEAPDYMLSIAQRLSLAAAIERDALPAERARLIDLTLKAANCYACHSRDGVGGPELTRNAFFRGTTPEMGNEGRVPPPLTGVGDKLTDGYFAEVLEKGANRRPYMKTRMPAFGYERMKLLHRRLIKADRISREIPSRDATPPHQRQADGRLLVGNEGLACIKCHTYGGEGTPGIQAIDMLVMPERLRRDWFVRYLLDPQAYRPGTRMPASFPNGVSVLTTVAEGDPHYQILAMWDFLAAGDPDRIPAGLRPEAIELEPQQRPILYRSFLEGLSTRGIAVGNPEGVHFAWDGETMALARVWRNQFLDVSKQWRGRGPGTIGPLGDAVFSPEATAPLALLAEPDAAWPEATGDAEGYRFGGYRLTRAGRPIFQYTVQSLRVEDEFTPQADADRKQLRRTIRWEGAVDALPGQVVLKLAAGSVERLEAGLFRVNDRWELRVAGGRPQLVQTGGETQLRVIPRGDQPSEVTVIYRW
jgi:mono/diheme cytochrome c family protein